MSMEEIISRWVNENRINQSDIPTILNEYCKIEKNRDLRTEELQALMQLLQFINFEVPMRKIARKYNYEFIEVLNTDGSLLCRLSK